MKRFLLVVAFVSLVVAVVCYLMWGNIDSATEETWNAWGAKIQLLWRIISIATWLSILSSVVSAFLMPRSRVGLALAGLLCFAALAFVAWTFFVMTHLRIG